MDLLRTVDIVVELSRITCPTLVCVGEMDPVTPVDASREIVGALTDGRARLEIIDGAGHFPWKDVPDQYWTVIRSFVNAATTVPTQARSPVVEGP